jgi:hypothetical protein
VTDWLKSASSMSVKIFADAQSREESSGHDLVSLAAPPKSRLNTK